MLLSKKKKEKKNSIHCQCCNLTLEEKRIEKITKNLKKNSNNKLLITNKNYMRKTNCNKNNNNNNNNNKSNNNNALNERLQITLDVSNETKNA